MPTKPLLRLAAALCLLLSTLANAQNGAAPATPKPATVPAPAAAPATTKAATETKSEERNIRFQFDGIPYADVLERFAQMTGKPLVAGTAIEGTMTFSDSRAYTYQEAFDTLNVMLAMKGVMLMEEGNFLRVVPFKELPSMPLKLLRGTDNTGDVRPAEVVTVVLELKSLDAQSIAPSITNMLSSAGSVAALSRGKGLIVTDRLANVQRIKALLGSVDSESVAERQMRTYTLLHASGAVIADLVNRTFGLATAPKRTQYSESTKKIEVLPPDPNDYITAVYDEASRTLVMFGPQERLTLADELISRFEDGGTGAGEVRIYTPELVKADDLANMIRQAIPGVASPNEPAASAATKARVITDTEGNRLIVATPIAGQADQIEALINRVDKPVHGNGGALRTAKGEQVLITKIFKTRYAEADNVGKILREALARKLPNGQTVPTSNITVEPKTQSVIITGSPGDIQLATDLLMQLETGTTTPRPQQTRFIELGTPAEAKRLMPLVEQIYRSQVTDTLNGSVASARILPEPETGRIIVTGSEDHIGIIEKIVEQLRVEKAPSTQRRVEIVPLTHTRLDAVLASITNLITDRMADKRFEELPKASVVPDTVNNRLLVTASEEQLKEIQQVVAIIDIAPEKQEREMAVIPVQSKPPAELISLVSDLLTQMGEPFGNPALAPKLIPDPSGKQIIILAAAKDITKARKLIEQLDIATTESYSRQFKGIDLRDRNASELTPLVTQLYQEQVKGVNDVTGGPATLIADDKNNRIMVSGTEREISRVENIIRQLDPSGRKSAREETRVIRMKAGLASEIAGLVEKSLTVQGGTLRVLVDSRSNSLVVTGEPGEVEAASKIIQQLDTRSDVQPREMRVIELKQGEASAISTMATPIIAELLKDQRGADYSMQAKLVPDTASNRLILSGPKDELDAITRVVDQLDQAPEGAGGAKVFKLMNADAIKIVGVVSNAMLKFDARNLPIRRASVSADQESNSLVVSGSRQDLKDAEAIIERLDNEGFASSAGNQTRQLKMLDVHSTDVDGLATLATRVFAAQHGSRSSTNVVSITPEPNGRRLIVLAPQALLPQVETVITALDGKPDQGVRELQAIDVRQGSATDMLTTVNRIYTEQQVGKTEKSASIYTDADGTRLMVFGTRAQADAVRQIVETIGSKPRAERQTKVVDLGSSVEVERVMPLLQKLYQDKFPTKAGMAAEAQFLPDGKSGRLVISAREDHLKEIDAILAQLQAGVAMPTARETRTFDVGNAAEVQRLQPLVQQLYTDQWKGRADGDTADAQILSDPVGGRLIVTGRATHITQIEAILAQLGAKQARPVSGARETRIFNVSTASATDLAATVKTLYGEEAKARYGALPADTLIMPDAAGNRIIAVGDSNELAVVESIVTKLDKVGTESASVKVFKLKSADPAKVSEILTGALVRFDTYGRAQKRVSVSVDALSRTLIITGDPKELQSASVIIEQLDASLGEQSQRKLKLITLKDGRSSELSTRLRQLFTDQAKNRPEMGTTEILILDDATSNQLILAGNDAQLKLLEEILDQLQAATPVRAPREVKVFELGKAEELTRLQPLVQQLYTDRLKSKSPNELADALFVADTRGARLIVTARPEHLAEIETILSTLRGPTLEPGSLDTRVFDLQTEDALELSRNVQSLYQEQLKARPGIVTSPALVLPDRASNRIVVSGISNEVNAVTAILKTLDTTNAMASGTRIFQLTNASPEQVASVISSSLSKLTSSGRSVPRVTVGTDTRSRKLIVSGDPKDVQAAGQIVEQFDQAVPGEARQMRIIPLTSGAATAVSTQLQNLFKDQVQTTGKPTSAEPLVLPDDTNNRLIITATETQWKSLEDILNQLQKGAQGTASQVQVISLKHVNASPVAQMITQLYSSKTAGRNPSLRLLVTASPDERTLLVDTEPAMLERITQLVESLDKAPTGKQSVFQTVQLKKGDAAALAEAVTNVMTTRGQKSPVRQVHITAVAGANALLLNGPDEAVQEMIKVVRELDQESESGEIQVRIYELKNSEARQVMPILNQLVTGISARSIASRSRSSSASRMNIAMDERSNSIIVTAKDEQFRLVEQLLPTLDKAPERSDRDVQFVWLKKAKALDVATKVTAVYEDRPAGERPLVEADEQSNSITIIARRSDLSQVQDLVNRLDESSKDTSLQVRLRTLSKIPAEQMSKMLTNIYPQMYSGKLRLVDKLALPGGGGASAAPAQTPGTNEVFIAVDRDANALILSGPTTELDQIDRIITELQWTALSGDADLQVFPLKEADPVVVARTLNELFRPETQTRVEPVKPGEVPRPLPVPKLVVVAEPRTRSIIVRAKATDFTLIETMIKQLDAAGVSAQLDFRLVPLENAPSEKVAPMVQQMATQMNLVRPGDTLTVTPYPRTRSLLIFARAAVIDQVEKLIKALDTPSTNAEVEMRVFALKETSAVQVSAVLQNMIRVGANGELTPEAKELQEQVRRLNIRNESGEVVTLDLAKPIKVMTDPAAGSGGGNRLLISSTTDNLVGLAAVVEMLDQAAITKGVEVGVIHLQHADATTVAQTLTTIFTQGRKLGTGPGGPAQPDGESGRALVSPLNVATDARLNTVILSGSKDSLALAQSIVRDLDKPMERFLTDVKLFRLKYASATRLVPLLQAVFAEGNPVPGSEGVSTYVTRLRTARQNGTPVTTEQPKSRTAVMIQADDALNVLIIAARTDALPLIEEVINQLDIPEASGLSTVRIYPLKNADATNLRKIITDLHNTPGRATVRNEDKPIITIDDRSNSLIVSGNEKAFAIIESLMQQLDRELPLELRDIRIIPLQHADATELSGTIQKLMDARVTRQGALGRGQAEALRVLVVPEQRSNSLLVGGGNDSYELVRSLVSQLDVKATALSGQVRLVPLEYADARIVANSLTALFTQRYAAAKSPETQRNKPVILADSRINGLLISAAVDDNAIIDDLIKRLDKRLENPALTLSILPLKHNDAGKLATTIESIFTARLRAQALPGVQPSASEQVKLETDTLNNALIVSANKENLELIQEMLQRLDVEPDIAGGVLETFVLQHADAQRVATMITGLVKQGLYRPGRPLVGGPSTATRDALAVAVDPRSNSLMVSASPENLVIVKELIARLDTQDMTAASNIKLYHLTKSRAEKMAGVLTQFFQAKRAGDAVALNAPERSIPVAIIPDSRINALLVTGSKEAFDILDRIVPQLDGEDLMAQLSFKVFPLKQATAVKLQSTLQKLFVSRPPRVKGETVDPITIVADSWINALIVGAVIEDMGMVESLITRLDSEQADLGITVEVIPLQKANAARVAQTVQGLYRDGAAGAVGSVVPIVVSADERVNALIVSGGETDLKRIREVVAKLDTDQVSRVNEIKVMPLKYARAEALATILNSALNTKPPALNEQTPNAQSVLQFITRTEDGRELVTAALKESILITPDTRMNSLVVSGPVDYMSLLEQIVNRLDNSSPREAQIKVFALKHANAFQTSQLLMSLFRMQATPSAANSQRSIQYTLMRPTINGEEGVASAILGIEEQSALTVSVDPRTNSLLVGGTEHYVGLVAEIIESLDASEALDRKTELYRLRNAQAADIAMAVRTFLDQDRQRVTQLLGADAVNTAQRLLDREVSVVAETNSNVLLISASPMFFDQVKEIITELDQQQPQVLIQVLLAEIAMDAVKDLGVEWTYAKNLSTTRNLSTGLDLGLPAQLAQFGGYSALVTGNDFDFLVRALESSGKVDVLSRPQILTADNVPATINIGQRIPLITDSRVTERGDTINSFRYEDVGVNLMVTPRISPDGFVMMDVGTTNSSVSSSTVEINKNATVPIINSRRATTSVSVQDGKTVVIGGLISNVEDERKRKVPFFGDIPYLGALFRSSKKSSERRELLIMLTPQIIASKNSLMQFRTMDTMSREQIDGTSLKPMIDKDSSQMEIIRPLYDNLEQSPKTPKERNKK